MYNQFYRICFLRNVRAKSEKLGLVDLRKIFFSELLGIEITIEMLQVLPTFAKDSLKRKKVLAVLDDVDDPVQLEALAVNDDDCFGLGSRIILISRDKQVLSSAEKIYEVKGLDCSDALQLLSMKAFKQNHPPVEYVELSKRVETYCKGVPLALKVLGSYLCRRTSKEWESALNKLKVSPDYNILKVLKVSYNALDRMEKSIFLDIACFFKGYDKSWVEDILDDWVIIRLMDKCLVTIVNNKLEMHDLIVEMGQDIARWKGSRLWNSMDIWQILTTIDNNAKKAVEGLFLDISKVGRVYLNDAVFSRMHNLRLLKFYRSFSHLKKEGTGFIFKSNCLKSLPNKLSLLDWEEYPFKSLPLNFYMENLVRLRMRNSKFALENSPPMLRKQAASTSSKSEHQLSDLSSLICFGHQLSDLATSVASSGLTPRQPRPSPSSQYVSRVVSDTNPSLSLVILLFLDDIAHGVQFWSDPPNEILSFLTEDAWLAAKVSDHPAHFDYSSTVSVADLLKWPKPASRFLKCNTEASPRPDHNQIERVGFFVIREDS
ncbi:disease resistance protein RUN1-like [Hevea brasiliensis]|uniref:disease resistance protein RUN1-like n=1 Tax=Hevea brasiliensis TaxID=3981 RepID=UPI0025CFC1CD|nr:disease resistance protein RUN1-like [Hevea brasiliensis]